MLESKITQFPIENRVALVWGLMYQCIGEFNKAKLIYINLKPEFTFYCESHLSLLTMLEKPNKQLDTIKFNPENKKQSMIVDLLNAMSADVNNNYHPKKYYY